MPQNPQKSNWMILIKHRKISLFVRVLVVLLCVLLFVKIFDCIMDPRNGAGVHFSEKNRVLAYESPSNWLGDGYDYEIYHFTDERMKEIIEKIENNNKWGNHPINSITLDSLNKWHGFIKHDSAAVDILKEYNYKNFIPDIDNGYYSLIDRSSDESQESKNRYGLRNFTVFLLDIDNNMLYYIALDM